MQGEAERPPQWDDVQGLHLARAQYLKAKATSYPWNQLSPNDHRWYFNAFSFPKCQSSHTVSGPKDNSVSTCPSPFRRQITHSRFTTRWINELPDLGENISAWLYHTAFSFPRPLVLWLGLSLLQPELCRTFPLEMPSVSILPTAYSFSTPLQLPFAGSCLKRQQRSQAGRQGWERKNSVAKSLVTKDFPDAKYAPFCLLCSALGVSSVGFLVQCV